MDCKSNIFLLSSWEKSVGRIGWEKSVVDYVQNIKHQVNSDYLSNQYLYLCLPVSGSYTLLTWACCFSYSSFDMGTMDL